MSLSQEDSGGQLDRCVRGEEQAWRELFQGHGALVAGIFRRIFGRRGLPIGQREVEELVADFFGDLCLRRAQTLGKFRGRSVRAFLAVAAANYGRTRALRAQRSRDLAAGYLEAAARDATPDVGPGGETPGERIAAILARCSAQEQVLFRLLYVEGASVEQASAFLGITREALYLRKHRFHQRIRSLLGESSRGAAESS